MGICPVVLEWRLFLEVIGGVTPKAWTGLLQEATGFGALLHYQARSFEECYQA